MPVLKNFFVVYGRMVLGFLYSKPLVNSDVNYIYIFSIRKCPTLSGKEVEPSVRAEQPLVTMKLSLVMRNQMVHQAPLHASTEFDSKIRATRVYENASETS